MQAIFIVSTAQFSSLPLKPDQMSENEKVRKSALRQRLLVAAGHEGGITAGIETDRIVTMAAESRDRLMLFHRLVCDLLCRDANQAIRRIQPANRLEIDLAVLRGTVFSIELLKDISATNPRTRKNLGLPAPASEIMDSLSERGAEKPHWEGYKAYMEAVWDSSTLLTRPPIDTVVEFLVRIDDVRARGAVVAVAAIYCEYLRMEGTPAEDLRREQLALMAAFMGGGVMVHRDGHILIT
jgi:hypothetical protein